jgi:hypothetical protein
VGMHVCRVAVFCSTRSSCDPWSGCVAGQRLK